LEEEHFLMRILEGMEAKGFSYMSRTQENSHFHINFSINERKYHDRLKNVVYMCKYEFGRLTRPTTIEGH